MPHRHRRGESPAGRYSDSAFCARVGIPGILAHGLHRGRSPIGGLQAGIGSAGPLPARPRTRNPVVGSVMRYRSATVADLHGIPCSLDWAKNNSNKPACMQRRSPDKSLFRPRVRARGIAAFESPALLHRRSLAISPVSPARDDRVGYSGMEGSNVGHEIP